MPLSNPGLVTLYLNCCNLFLTHCPLFQSHVNESSFKMAVNSSFLSITLYILCSTLLKEPFRGPRPNLKPLVRPPKQSDTPQGSLPPHCAPLGFYAQATRSLRGLFHLHTHSAFSTYTLVPWLLSRAQPAASLPPVVVLLLRSGQECRLTASPAGHAARLPARLFRGLHSALYCHYTAPRVSFLLGAQWFYNLRIWTWLSTNWRSISLIICILIFLKKDTWLPTEPMNDIQQPVTMHTVFNYIQKFTVPHILHVGLTTDPKHTCKAKAGVRKKGTGWRSTHC